VTEPSPVVDPSTTLQVPTPAALVVAPTPQDRVLLPTGHSSCGCPPAVSAVARHVDGCPGRATP
jgi:hypothetical protein